MFYRCQYLVIVDILEFLTKKLLLLILPYHVTEIVSRHSVTAEVERL